MTLEEKTAKAAAEWWGERLQSGDREKFQEHIEKSVLTDLLDGRKVIRLECDYDPNGVLLEAVHKAGLECDGVLFSARGILPEKHVLTVRVGKLEPKEGYGNWTDPITIQQ